MNECSSGRVDPSGRAPRGRRPRALSTSTGAITKQQEVYSLKPWYCQRAQFSLNVSIGRGRVALRSRTSSCLFNSYKSYITKRLRVRSRYATIFDTTDTASLSRWSKSVLIHTFLQINKYMQTIERGRGNKLIVQSVTV